MHVRIRNNFFHRLIRSLCQCDGSFGSVVDERKANNLYDVKSRVNNIALIYQLIISLRARFSD